MSAREDYAARAMREAAACEYHRVLQLRAAEDARQQAEHWTRERDEHANVVAILGFDQAEARDLWRERLHGANAIEGFGNTALIEPEDWPHSPSQDTQTPGQTEQEG